jgi:hypothetical protein
LTTDLHFQNSPRSLTTVILHSQRFVLLAEQEMYGFAQSFQWVAGLVLVEQRELLA